MNIQNINRILDQLDHLEVERHPDFDLSKISWLKQKGNIALLIRPDTKEKLSAAIRCLEENHLNYKFIGNSSNCYFAGRNHGVFIHLNKLKKITIEESSGMVTAESGAQLIQVARKAVASSLAGFEGLVGIPGTVGGAVFMNAGSYGCDIAKILDHVTVIGADGLVTELKCSELGFGTRTSFFKTGEINGCIVSACFKLQPEPQESIRNRMEKAIQHRAAMQEKSEPNLGSMFIAYQFYQNILCANPVIKYLSLPIRLPLAVGNRVWRFFFPLRISPFDLCLMRFYKVVFRYPLKKRVHSRISLNVYVKTNNQEDEHSFEQYAAWIEKISKGKLELENEIVRAKNS